jgi:hypothetical protein
MEEEAARWMRNVESNVEQVVGRTQQIAMVEADIARQEFARAHLEAGAVHHHRQQIGAFENAATLEMSALNETLATFEQSEIHRAQAPAVQLHAIEVEADALFHQRIQASNAENITGQRSEIARVESLAEQRHLAYRAEMHSELNSAIEDSREAQLIASDLSIKCHELREEVATSLSHKKSAQQ